jgi:hypothetical protein
MWRFCSGVDGALSLLMTFRAIRMVMSLDRAVYFMWDYCFGMNLDRALGSGRSSVSCSGRCNKEVGEAEASPYVHTHTCLGLFRELSAKVSR